MLSRLIPFAFVAFIVAAVVVLVVNFDNLSRPKLEITVSSEDEPSGGANAVSQTREFELVTVLAFDTIRSIDEPIIYEREKANTVYLDEELILGLEIDGEARAYSVPLLSGREIVNDTLAGIPIAITW